MAYFKQGIFLSNFFLIFFVNYSKTQSLLLDERITGTLQDYVNQGMIDRVDADRINNEMAIVINSGSLSSFDADRMLRHFLASTGGMVTKASADSIMNAIRNYQVEGPQSIYSPEHMENVARKYGFVRPWYHRFYEALNNAVRWGYENTKYVADHLVEHAQNLRK